MSRPNQHSRFWHQVVTWMIDSHPCDEHFSMTLRIVCCEVKLLFDSTEQIIQTSYDVQTEINFIRVFFPKVTQFPTNMGSIRTYIYIAQVMSTVPFLYLKLTL